MLLVKDKHGRDGHLPQSSCCEGAGGGGGGYYGGYACQTNVANDNAAGSGGSGYVSPVLINATTEQGTGSTGNGYAKITKYSSGFKYI